MIFTNITRTSYKFSAKNTSLSTLYSFSCARAAVLTCPALLKSLSDGELLAWMTRYLLANWQSNGSSFTCNFHHCRGSSSPSITGNAAM